MMPEAEEGSAAAPAQPDRFDLVVFGEHFQDWVSVLAPDAPIWAGVPSVRSVQQHRHIWDGDVVGEPGMRLVLPLIEYNISTCPRQCWALVPEPEALAILSDKAQFAAYADAHGLGPYMPRAFEPMANASFPAILKRTNMYGGIGMRVVHSAHAVAASLEEEPWAGQPVILQEYVGASFEYTTHVVARAGAIKWHRTYEFEVDAAALIRVPKPGDLPRPVEIAAGDVAILERFLEPLGFSGPCNFNFRRRPSGEMAVFEINPRFGGSLFRPARHADLAEALNVIVAHVEWRD
jgi:predicted ATP-grasp superfamily ATP-dependent carboligase